MIRYLRSIAGIAEYADGYYDYMNNRIVVNPKGTRSVERVMLHELDHAIRTSTKKGVKFYKEAINGVDAKDKERILVSYIEDKKITQSNIALVYDEINAYYAEQVLSNSHTLEKLIENKPKLEDKILSFFKKSSTDYTDTLRFHELLGGYADRDSFVPVRYGVKELKSGKCFLYVVVCQDKVDLQKIKTEVLEMASTGSVSITSRSVNISIAQLIKNVNPQNTDILRYLPDETLSDEQRTAKWQALAMTLKYTDNKNDKAYSHAIEKGDMATARIIVANAAKAWGAYSNNGKPLVLYHGSNNFGWTVYKQEKTYEYGVGKIWLTDRLDVAEGYSGSKGLQRIRGRKPIDFGKMSIGEAIAYIDSTSSYLKGCFKEETRNGENIAVHQNGSKYRIEDMQEMAKSVSVNKGNYSLYAQLISPLVINGEGASNRYVPITKKMYSEIFPYKETYLKTEYFANTEEIAEYAMKKGYDGVVFNDIADVNAGKALNGKMNVIAVFSPEQIRSADPVTYDDNGKIIPISERFNINNKDIRYAVPLGDRKYSYDELIKKPDMKVTELKRKVPLDSNGKVNRGMVRVLAMKNVREQQNKLNTNSLAYVHCDDTGTDIRIGSRGLNHGLDRRVEVNAKASLVIGDLIKNAIKVNEVNSLSQGHEGDYVLLSCFSDETGVYGVSIYVDRVSNEVTGMDSIDILYSANGKKIGTAAPNAEVSDRSPSPTVPTISISQLLEKSNRLFKDVFSKDVYARFGTEKDTSTKLGSTTRYAKPLNDTDSNEKGTNDKEPTGFAKVKYRRAKNAADAFIDFCVDKLMIPSNSKPPKNDAEALQHIEVLSKRVVDKGIVADYLYTTFAMTRKGSQAQIRAAADIADALFNKTIVRVDDNPGVTVPEDVAEQYNTLKRYLHSFELDRIKDEIKYRYDDNNGIYLKWSRGKNRKAGLTPDMIVPELAEKGIVIEATNEADLFRLSRRPFRVPF